MEIRTFATLPVGDAFTFTPKGPRFVKESANTYRTAGGGHVTHCDGARPVLPLASVAEARGIERMRSIAAMRRAVANLDRGYTAIARAILMDELGKLAPRTRNDR